MSFVRRRQQLEQGAAGTKAGPNGTLLVSTGLADLDKALGGGVPVGSMVVVLEDADAPHHLLLLRYFMAQAAAQQQPLLFLTSLASPKPFLSTLPAPTSSTTGSSAAEEAEALRIAWQYRKYDAASSVGANEDYCARFDLRRACDAASSSSVECLSLIGEERVEALLERCHSFLAAAAASSASGSGGRRAVARLAIHSLCAPQCMAASSEWELLTLLVFLKSMLHSAQAVGLVTLPRLLLACPARWEHIADVLLSVKALPDDDAVHLEQREAVGLLQVHKLPSINTQVPSVPPTAAYMIKIKHKKEVCLEPLQLAPVDAAGGSTGDCSSSF